MMQLLRLLPLVGYVYALQQETQHNLHDPSQEILVEAPVDRSGEPKNYAAILPWPQAQLKVVSLPFPDYEDDELVIKNHVVAINPVDWKIQSPIGRNFNLTYPVVLGEDVAGVVVKVGSKIKSKFAVGDRVIAHPLGLGNGPAYGGFQLYPLLKSATVAKIPDSISFEDAAVLPLSISTAAAGLYLKTTLGLKKASIRESSTRQLGKPSTLLVWGGSSSVGSSVIQLASAAGYNVVATASSSNYEYCKNLGAAEVLDYHNDNIVKQLIGLLKGKNVVGVYDAIGSDITVRQSAAILHALGGGKIASVGLAPEVFSDVTVSRISSGNIVTEEPEVAEAIWGEYVPWALKSGDLVPSPDALVVGKGLGDVQKGLDRQKEGVSARKVEILLA